MPKNVRLTLQLLAALLSLFVVVQLSVADTATDQPAEVDEPVVMADVDAPIGGCGDEADTFDFSAFDPSTEWGRDNMSCFYTCPWGSPVLCPERIDHTTSCVNGCCVWTANCQGSCNTHQDCIFPLICNPGAGCCVDP